MSETPGRRQAPIVAEEGSAEYRRQARYLRCRLAGRPATLHWALGDLARQQDSRPRPWAASPVACRHPVQRTAITQPGAARDPVLTSILGLPGTSADRLVRLVEQSLCDGVLPYSRRQDVLRAARRLGVGRFQANLLIAAVQHRHETPPATSAPRRAHKSFPWLAAVALIVALEAAAVIGAIFFAHLT